MAEAVEDRSLDAVENLVFRDTQEGVVDVLEDAAGSAIRTVGDAVDDAEEAVFDAYRSVKDAAAAAARKTGDVADALEGCLCSAVDELPSSVDNTLDETVGAAVEVVANTCQDVDDMEDAGRRAVGRRVVGSHGAGPQLQRVDASTWGAATSQTGEARERKRSGYGVAYAFFTCVFAVFLRKAASIVYDDEPMIVKLWHLLTFFYFSSARYVRFPFHFVVLC